MCAGGREIGEGGRDISPRVMIKVTVRVYSPPAAMLANQGQGRRAVCEPAVRGRHDRSRQNEALFMFALILILTRAKERGVRGVNFIHFLY